MILVNLMKLIKQRVAPFGKVQDFNALHEFNRTRPTLLNSLDSFKYLYEFSEFARERLQNETNH